MKHATGTVYLTDGFERLDLPGIESTFTLGEDWIAHGTECRWRWTHPYPGVVAGAEVEINGSLGPQTAYIDVGGLDGPPAIVEFGHWINFVPNFDFRPDPPPDERPIPRS